ncbi:MAG: hypothetical protein NTY81_00045 [Candidatus Staskawiczbacteria bacterium]|nr:hypothetical protein [Candidatus Staskawiczbacteria bacterium]
MDSEKRVCQNCKQDFTIESDDFAFYEKIKVPAPTFCWLCRAQRRMAFRNERFLFKRKSDFNKDKDIFSAFSPDASVKVYEKEVWLTDVWDPMTFGKDFDESKTFFEQFKELLYKVPLKNLNVVNGVKSDYVNNFTDPKNCYLIFNGQGAEDCMYGNALNDSKSSVDNSHISKSERCYEGFWLTTCRNAIFSSQCESSYDISFCKDCVGCSDCFGCVGLRKKSFFIFNEQYAKEDYIKKIAEFNLSSSAALEQMRKKVAKFWLKFPNKYINGLSNTNVSGNYISHSRNVHESFLVRESENLRFCQYVQEMPATKDSYDYTAWGAGNQQIYECVACGLGTNNIKFCYNVQQQVHDIEYSYMCESSSNLFGCVGLRKKEYCILNKQYTKEEYEKLVEKIKQQMNDKPYIDAKARVYKYGEFFPAELSPFAYNETLAQENFPITKEQAKEFGFAWRDAGERNYKITKQADDLPDSIKDVPDSITAEIIGCQHEGNCNDQCTLAFRVLPDELAFYRSMNLPLPRLCPNCRHVERINQRTKLNLYKRQCQCGGLKSENGVYQNNTKHSHGEEKCPNEFETSYSPDRPEIVYCEQCYQQEVS